MRPTDIVTSIHWFDAETHRPPCSGMYLSASPSGLITTLSYSKKYDVFNCSDDDDYDLVRIYTRNIRPAYWAHIPEELTNRLGEVWNETHQM